jgi:hypothetical protein
MQKIAGKRVDYGLGAGARRTGAGSRKASQEVVSDLPKDDGTGELMLIVWSKVFRSVRICQGVDSQHFC